MTLWKIYIIFRGAYFLPVSCKIKWPKKLIHNETYGIMLSDQTQQPKGNKMDRLNNTTTQRKSKHLNYEKRIKIEALYKSGMKSEEIGHQIGCSGRTVRREIKKV